MLAVVSRNVLHEHLSGKRNNRLLFIFAKICQYDVYFRARLDDSSVSARCCVCSAWTKSPVNSSNILFDMILAQTISTSRMRLKKDRPLLKMFNQIVIDEFAELRRHAMSMHIDGSGLMHGDMEGVSSLHFPSSCGQDYLLNSHVSQSTK
ncbi:hypothetical protein J6590_076614 [Homalodisca vitripennis]|nr:hypothetical protein J6590_076614 [Homalodisca vitripennis]